MDYITGGGFAEDDLPLERLSEGYAVLRACIEQFSMQGYKIATLIDQRLMQHIRITPIHDFISVSTTEDFINGLNHFGDQVDYSLTIAPESKGILKDLSSMMTNSKSQYLGSKPEAIEIAADKIVDQLINAWENVLNNGSSLYLKVKGLSLNKESDFKRILTRYLRGIKEIHSKDFKNGVFTYKLMYLGDGKQLAKELSSVRGSLNINVTGYMANTVEAELK